LLVACTASSSEVSPPRYDLYYPTGLAIAPTAEARHLFVLNANSDLRYDAGTLQVIDLDRIDEAAECRPDERVESLVNCPTTLEDRSPAPFLVDRSTVKVGNFGAALAAQLLEDGTIRLFATVRGDPSVTWADFDGTALQCGGSGDLPRCAENRRLDVLFNDPELGALPSEPFMVYADGDAEHVFVTHLTTGLVTLLNAPRNGAAPQIHDVLGGLFSANSGGVVRAVGIAARQPGNRDGLVYVTSSSEARVSTVHVVEGPLVAGAPALRLAAGPTFFFGEQDTPGVRSDARGVAFDPSGDRAYVVSREPAELLLLDTSEGPTGAPRNELVDSVEVCAQSSGVVLADFGSGLTAWLPCFGTGQVWVVDAERMRFQATVDVGRGPNAIVADPLRRRVYVANYAEDTITVIDADPENATFHAPIYRLGNRREL
jgi:DNA-binding beta-propeller fold protein YncE